ncbi:3-deoxy-D-manno-octulosonic acid transferase [Mucilaginibacter sp.]|jgi:3-deoxy-D-manno-octulosonic-acid transferase|uniref:3-deoxy-D-manno-octulosonic acid transferase n=1 Tax=Mucilaginibacter sp. TaxID=1882438 RepID=UPI002CB5255C|nr:glycosyltransferase N-terminal domain-containing protein [Mucilaginibacter sp.]HTI59192.1 glycosyltransferase N-terminal domain-containing protein [Mucilaginibacter sp.]
MLPLYNLGLRIYVFLIYIASFFNKKANAWLKGRSNIQYPKFDKSAWFHFASLGEYEQGLPVLAGFRSAHSDTAIVITFFSPSGYEIRKNTPLADAVYYLPLDTAANARHFIDAIQPTIAVFTKYEYWYHYFYELNRKNVPLFVISGIFRPNQVFFKWYGSLYREMLGFVTHFFVQDENSKNLLQNIHITNVSVSGDTRFDRVWANAQSPKSFPLIQEFTKGSQVFIAGSTWPEDEELLAQLIKTQPNWKFIIAPHEIKEEKINRFIALLPENSTSKYSLLTAHHAPLTNQTLIIDNIGILSSLYQYGQVAYIGGGFGAGIHNTLEAAAFGLPVIFGPNYHKFKEARDLVSLELGFSINNAEELKETFSYLMDDTHLKSISKKIKDYVKENTGATEMIMKYLDNY